MSSNDNIRFFIFFFKCGNRVDFFLVFTFTFRGTYRLTHTVTTNIHAKSYENENVF